MIKRHFFLIAAAALLGLMVVALVMRMAFASDEKGGQRGPGGPGGGRGQAVSEAVATTREFSDQIRVLGVARGRRSVNITSSTSELITRVMFRDGQRVAAGTPLVQLQAREEDAAIAEARAQVARARTMYDRYRTLNERGFASDAMVEQYETELESAQASLAAANARAGDRTIRAPFAGVLGLSTVTAGTLVNPGAVIATLDDIDVVRVDFPIPERYVSVLRTGAPITASIDAYGDEVFTGRIALVDFDVHHGNGTQDVLWHEPRALFFSSHQMPLWPGTGEPSERGAHGQIVNLPLAPGSDGAAMRALYAAQVLPRLRAFAPDLIVISAGFDAHRADPLAGLCWQVQDFAWLTREICAVARDVCAGRVVSVPEGGYDLPSLGASVAAHVAELMAGGA